MPPNTITSTFWKCYAASDNLIKSKWKLFQEK